MRGEDRREHIMWMTSAISYPPLAGNSVGTFKSNFTFKQNSRRAEDGNANANENCYVHWEREQQQLEEQRQHNQDKQQLQQQQQLRLAPIWRLLKIRQGHYEIMKM